MNGIYKMTAYRWFNVKQNNLQRAKSQAVIINDCLELDYQPDRNVNDLHIGKVNGFMGQSCP